MITLEPIPKGFQDVYEGVADEEVELNESPIEQLSGNSTATIRLLEPKKVELTVRADGDIGLSSIRAKIDGHVGPGDAVIATDFEWATVSKDATEVTFNKVRREKIPTA